VPNGVMRVVIDTNIWISFLIGKSLVGLSDAIIANHVQILFSDHLFSELLEVLKRPKFQKYFSNIAIEQLIALLYKKIEWVEVVNDFNIVEMRKTIANSFLCINFKVQTCWFLAGQSSASNSSAGSGL
jgi:putative PIN family toxin of toxin-antitoxin system